MKDWADGVALGYSRTPLSVSIFERLRPNLDSRTLSVSRPYGSEILYKLKATGRSGLEAEFYASPPGDERVQWPECAEALSWP